MQGVADLAKSMAAALGGSGSVDTSGLDQAMGGLSQLEGTTNWMLVFKLNVATYAALTGFILCMVISAFHWCFAFLGCCGFCLTQCLHLATVIITGVFRYSADGQWCAGMAYPLQINERTSADVGANIQGLFISQCVLYLGLNCCIGCLLQAAMGVAMAKKAMHK